MRISTVLAIASLLGSALPGVTARAGAEFEASVVGIEVGGQVVAGIPGGAPWTVDVGEVRIRNGELDLEVEGLLLLNGTVGPVFEVIASLHCASGGEGEEAFTEVARTGSFPLSPAGDAEVEELIDVPEQCSAAIVLVRVKVIDAGFVGGPPGVPLDLEALGIVPPWIAASGL